MKLSSALDFIGSDLGLITPVPPDVEQPGHVSRIFGIQRRVGTIGLDFAHDARSRLPQLVVCKHWHVVAPGDLDPTEKLDNNGKRIRYLDDLRCKCNTRLRVCLVFDEVTDKHRRTSTRRVEPKDGL